MQVEAVRTAPSTPGAGTPADSMADITRLNPRTVRILGQNPNQFTLNGPYGHVAHLTPQGPTRT